MKRNTARNTNRKMGKASKEAQEPNSTNNTQKQSHRTTQQIQMEKHNKLAFKLQHETQLKILNLNTQGMKSAEKRILIEKYMTENNIDIDRHRNTNRNAHKHK